MSHVSLPAPDQIFETTDKKRRERVVIMVIDNKNVVGQHFKADYMRLRRQLFNCSNQIPNM